MRVQRWLTQGQEFKSLTENKSQSRCVAEKQEYGELLMPMYVGILLGLVPD